MSKEKLVSLRRLRKDLHKDYNKLVLPYGLGYGMPEDVSRKATGILEHMENVSKKIKVLEAQLGIQSKPTKIVSNAREVGAEELSRRMQDPQKLLDAVAYKMGWSSEDLLWHLSGLFTAWIHKHVKDPCLWSEDERLELNAFLMKRSVSCFAKVVSEDRKDFTTYLLKTIEEQIFALETSEMFTVEFPAHE